MELSPDYVQRAEEHLTAQDWLGAWKTIAALPIWKQNELQPARIKLRAATQLGWWDVGECLVAMLSLERDRLSREAIGKFYLARASSHYSNGETARAALAWAQMREVAPEMVLSALADPSLRELATKVSSRTRPPQPAYLRREVLVESGFVITLERFDRLFNRWRGIAIEEGSQEGRKPRKFECSTGDRLDVLAGLRSQIATVPPT